MKLLPVTVALFKSAFKLPQSLRQYFETHEARERFFPHRLANIHGLSKRQAAVLSFLLNNWSDTIAEVYRVDKRVARRMSVCTDKFAGWTPKFSCGHFMCPWCSAYRLLTAYDMIRKLHPSGYSVRNYAVGERCRPPADVLFAVRTLAAPLTSSDKYTRTVMYFDKTADGTTEAEAKTLAYSMLLHNKGSAKYTDLNQALSACKGMHLIQTFRCVPDLTKCGTAG